MSRLLLLLSMSFVLIYASANSSLVPEPYIFGVTVDISDAEIMGLQAEDFDFYYCGRYERPEGYTKVMFRKFEKTFESAFNGGLSHAEVMEQNNPNIHCVLKISLITDKAGIKGTLQFVNSTDSIISRIPVEVSDGRMAEFEKLLFENAESGGITAKKELEKIQASAAYVGKEVFDNSNVKHNYKFTIQIAIYVLEFRNYGEWKSQSSFERYNITEQEAKEIAKRYRARSNSDRRYRAVYEIIE